MRQIDSRSRQDWFHNIEIIIWLVIFQILCQMLIIYVAKELWLILSTYIISYIVMYRYVINQVIERALFIMAQLYRTNWLILIMTKCLTLLCTRYNDLIKKNSYMISFFFINARALWTINPFITNPGYGPRSIYIILLPQEYFIGFYTNT